MAQLHEAKGTGSTGPPTIGPRPANVQHQSDSPPISSDESADYDGIASGRAAVSDIHRAPNAQHRTPSPALTYGTLPCTPPPAIPIMDSRDSPTSYTATTRSATPLRVSEWPLTPRVSALPSTVSSSVNEHDGASIAVPIRNSTPLSVEHWLSTLSRVLSCDDAESAHLIIPAVSHVPTTSDDEGLLPDPSTRSTASPASVRGSSVDCQELLDIPTRPATPVGQVGPKDVGMSSGIHPTDIPCVSEGDKLFNIRERHRAYCCLFLS